MMTRLWNVRRLWARLLAGLAAPSLLALGSVASADGPAPAPPPAAAAPAVAADLCGLRNLALDNQPALTAYRASVEAAQVKARALDDLVLAGLVRKDLPYRRQQARLGILAAQAQLCKAEWETVYGVTRTYVSALYARQQKQIADRALDKDPANFRSLFYLKDVVDRALKAKDDPDKPSRRDIREWHRDYVETLVGVAGGRRAEADQGVERALAALREAVGLDPCTPLALVAWLEPRHLPPCRGDVVALAVGRRAEVTQAKVGEEVTCLEVAAQDQIRGPSGDTFASATDLHAQPVPQGLADGQYRPGAVTVEMPATLIGHRSARVEQARALHRRAEAVVDKARQLVTLEAEDAYLRWQEAAEQATRYREAARKAARAAESVRREFNPNLPAATRGTETRPTLDDLIEYRVRATQLHLLANQARYQEFLALVTLERVTAGGFAPCFEPAAPPRDPQDETNGGKEDNGGK